MRGSRRRVSPRVAATVSWTGTPAIDVAAGVVAQLRANDVAVQWVSGLHAGVRQAVLLPPRRPDRPFRGRRRLLRRARVSERAGTSWPPGSAAVAGAHRRGLRRRGTPPDGGRARRGHQVLPGSGRRPARGPRGAARGGEPRPGGRAPRSPSCATATELSVHFIGQLQTNKAAARWPGTPTWCTPWTGPSSLMRWSGAPHAAGRRLEVLVQVGLDHEPRHAAGVGPADALRLADQVAQAPDLDLRGVMAVAPLGADPARGVRRGCARCRRHTGGAPGGSLDLRRDERATSRRRSPTGRHTCVSARAILGSRPPLR